MLLRAVSRFCPLRQGKQVARLISTTTPALGGHGHDHHEPVPVYIPQPGSLDWSLCGRPGVKRISQDNPYEPKADDIFSFVGAAVGVALTIAAIVIYTDALKPKQKGHGHEKPHHTPATATEVHEKPAKVDEPVVEAVPEPVAEKEEETPTPEPVPAEEPAAQEPSEPVASTSTAAPPAEETAPEVAETESKERPIGKVQYVIVGSGTAAYYASIAIRAKDQDAKVLMIGEDSQLPYNKPPLSKELWWYGNETASEKYDYTGLSGKKRDIFYETQGWFVKEEDLPEAKHGGVALIKGVKVTKVCAKDRRVYLEDGTSVRFEKLLIATGSIPEQLKELEAASDETKEKIVHYHGTSDFSKLYNGLSDGTYKSVTVVGGGVLGSELAYGIKRRFEGVQVNQVYAEKFNGTDVLPGHLAEKATRGLEEMGIKVYPNEKITGARKCCKNVVLQLSNSEVRSDVIVVALPSQPNTQLAEASEFPIDPKNGGIVADSELKVAENVWVAGDVASLEDKVLGRRRNANWENAEVTGRLAGGNMTGKGPKSFWYQPSFFTKFAPHLHVNAVGNTDPKLETVTVFAEIEGDSKLEKAVVFYKDPTGIVVGVLLVNVFGQSLDVVRRIIDDKPVIKDFKELSKLFPLYEIEKEKEEEEPKKL